MSDWFLVNVFVKGGPVMVPIILCSILGVAVMINRIGFYLTTASDPELLMKKVRAALGTRDYTEALRLCRREFTPVGEVVAAGIDHLDQPREIIQDRMRQEALRQMKRVERFNGVLSTIASISPLLGLTGTVTGMIASFGVITTIGLGDPTALAGGISEALYTTAAGLFIGIPALVGYNWCEGQVKKFEEAVEFCSLDLINHIPSQERICEKTAA